ncbi:hypothetical protein IAE57_00035 [Stenotrophomonas sp. S48]|uniref:hypothetical protein n=1 Tax=unclassified Stenotrophomonas TaxID=196198 RepID=UPI001902B273|nr:MULTISPECIES: hypothetical protein [unclassified Stenotrophomonas]MBK0024542.1 hypothetical protein [Stenotrophomonas sp. S48]MBK0046669.1 hypothetical protein [Stenotrophomonas sp. S49]
MHREVEDHLDRNEASPTPRHWKALLDEVDGYRNEQVTFRFCRHFDIPREEATVLLRQVMKWLWLCEYNRQCNPRPISLRIDRPLKIVDEMWHNFILHTHEYARVCEQYFGSFVQHFPATEADFAAHDALRGSLHPRQFASDQMDRRRAQYEMVYDLLGERTFRRWYVEYPRVYTPEAIKALRR